MSWLKDMDGTNEFIDETARDMVIYVEGQGFVHRFNFKWCVSCGGRNDKDGLFCEHCGTELED